MLTLVLAEAELELVPESVRDHPSVQKSAQARGQRGGRSLLDSSVHHTALVHVRDGERRGRPDLVHFSLLLALDGLLNQRGGLRILVHTRNDELIRVRRDTRLMRHYPRFLGLMEQLFRFGQVPQHPAEGQEPFLAIESGWTLKRVVEKHARGPVVAFDDRAEVVSLPAFLQERATEAADPADPDLTVILGCFPKGDYASDVHALAERVVSIAAEPLSVWSVESALLSYWEAVTGVAGENPLRVRPAAK